MSAEFPPQAAPSVVMDQRGNYWRVYPKGTVPGTDEETWSMCPTSTANYDSEPVAIYRQGRDMSAQQARELVDRIVAVTPDDADGVLIRHVAQSAWHSWVAARDALVEAELTLELLVARQGVTGGSEPTAGKAPSQNAPSSFASCEPLCIRGEHTIDCQRHQEKPRPSGPPAEHA